MGGCVFFPLVTLIALATLLQARFQLRFYCHSIVLLSFGFDCCCTWTGNERCVFYLLHFIIV